MKFCSLSSCSYANCVVVRERNTCILIDCGLRKRDLKPFLGKVGLSPGDIDAVLITHCHTDHIYGLKYFLKEKDVPVYSTAGILKHLNQNYTFYDCPRFTVLNPHLKEKIGGLVVTPFHLSHDVETIGFTINGDGERMGLITDTGFVPEHCIKAFQSLDYIYIESNHDVEMYKRSSKPRHVIRRNLGPTGHLSNEQCGLALQAMALNSCKLVMLGHLSENDNEPRKALNKTRQYIAQETALASAPSRSPSLWSNLLTNQKTAFMR